MPASQPTLLGDPAEQICSDCLTLKPTSAFDVRKRKHHRDTISKRCTECRKKKYRDYYAADPTKMQGYQRQYYRQNKEYVSARQQAYADRPERKRRDAELRRRP